MISEYALQQIKYLKQFAYDKVVYKTPDGIYTWFKDTKALYYKEKGLSYFNNNGQFIDNIAL